MRYDRRKEDNILQTIIDIGIALSAERDHDKLMERILFEAKRVCNADAGTLYLRTDDDRLKFEIMRTDSLNLKKGGSSGEEGMPAPINIHDPDTKEPNFNNIASYSALTGAIVNIPNAYESDTFDFGGVREFDRRTGYRSISFLTVPMKSFRGEVIGVIQLLNAMDRESGQVVPFPQGIEPLIASLTSQAAVALDNQNLLLAEKNLLDSFITVIAGAIDAKSPYTGSHCQRVPTLMMMLAEEAHDSKEEAFKTFRLDDTQRYEIEIAALMHDCGKVTTPEFVVDKATKLETLYDRIHEIRTRFEVLKRDAEIECLRGILDGGDEAALKQHLERELAALDDDFAFIAGANRGGEFMTEEDTRRLEELAGRTWTRTIDNRLGVSLEELKRMQRKPARPLPVEEPLLADRDDHIIERPEADHIPIDNPYGFKMDEPDHEYNRGELHNLSVRKGTLTEEERYRINHHMIQTVIMLEQLPFPRHLKNVPEIAGGHHETMVGTGYPRRLWKDKMSLPARMMAIADIFEALTACDRPYKRAKTLSESLEILWRMKHDRHIDPDIFHLFLQSGIYLRYAEEFLTREQIDEVDISRYLDELEG